MEKEEKKEFITKIKCLKFMAVEKEGKYSTPQVFIGYQITTNLQTILFGIENTQKCCEDYGIKLLFSTPTKKELLNTSPIQRISWEHTLKKTNYKLVPSKLEKDELAIAEILLTNKEWIQIVAWNQHNGYYKHRVYFERNTQQEFQNV